MPEPSFSFPERFRTAQAQGPRDEQQDATGAWCSPEQGTAVLVVCDGVGGSSGGRLASQTAVALAEERWKGSGGRLAQPAEALRAWCREAHERIYRAGEESGQSPRTTVVILYLEPGRAWWVHSGDSRLYRFPQAEPPSRTLDHSVLQAMLDHGIIKPDEVEAQADTGALMQALGGEEFVEPSEGMAAWSAGDGFLLCTDGFWRSTSMEEMAALAGGQGGTLEEAVQRAVERNGPRGDNVTVAVAFPAASAARTEGASPRRTGLGAALLGLAFLASAGMAVHWWPSLESAAVLPVRPPVGSPTPASERSAPSKTVSPRTAKPPPLPTPAHPLSGRWRRWISTTVHWFR